jgi:serine O-acetyltransferase
MFDPVPFYRLARWLYSHRIPILPRAIKRVSELLFHCVLPYTADIGSGFQVGYHGFGIVVHARARIGNQVFISPEVTIGGRSGSRGVPSIGNDIFIASGARILGDVTIGDGSLIGANAVVIRSVPPRCIAAGVPARIIRENIDVHEYTGWPGSLVVPDEFIEAEA